MKLNDRVTFIEAKVRLIEKLIYGLGVLIMAQMGLNL